MIKSIAIVGVIVSVIALFTSTIQAIERNYHKLFDQYMKTVERQHQRTLEQLTEAREEIEKLKKGGNGV